MSAKETCPCCGLAMMASLLRHHIDEYHPEGYRHDPLGRGGYWIAAREEMSNSLQAALAAQAKLVAAGRRDRDWKNITTEIIMDPEWDPEDGDEPSGQMSVLVRFTDDVATTVLVEDGACVGDVQLYVPGCDDVVIANKALVKSAQTAALGQWAQWVEEVTT